MKREWPTKPLQSLCEDVNVGHVGPSSMHRDPKGISFLMGKNIGTGVIYTHNVERVTEGFHRSQPKSKLRPGDIVVVRIGKSGQAAKIPDSFGEANCSGLVIIKQPHGIHPDFLVYYLNSPIGRGYSLSQARGSTRLTLNTSSVAETLVPVPPLAEQRRIVGILDEAFEGLATAKANAEQNLQNARALFESHLQAVFTQRGHGWVETTIEEVCIIGDGNHSSNYPTKDELVEVGVPFIRATNMVGGRISGDDMRFLSPQKHAQLKKGHLKTGDILITNRGEIGKTAIVDADYDNANLNSQIAWLRCQEGMDNKFLFHVLNSGDIQQHFESSKSGAALQQFTIKQLKALKVPSPPKPQQLSIVEQLDALSEETQRLESLYQRKLAALDELKKSLLHRAFTGQL